MINDQGERREKYTYPKGATAVLSEKVRDIKVRQVGGSQVSFHGFLLDFQWISSEFSSNFSHLLKGWGQEPRLHRGLRGGETDCNGGGLGDLGGCPRLGQSDGTFNVKKQTMCENSHNCISAFEINLLRIEIVFEVILMNLF